MSRTTAKTRLLSSLVYVSSCAPDEFPEEDETSLEGEFAELRLRISAFRMAARAVGAQEQYRLAELEVEEAYQAYRDGNRVAGRRAIERAREHVEDGFGGRIRKVRFVAGPTGVKSLEKGHAMKLSRRGLEPTKLYRMLLVERAGVRQVEFVEVDAPRPDWPHLRTAPVAGAALSAGQRNLLGAVVSLEDGGRFEMEAHGGWFTKHELEAIEKWGWKSPNIPWTFGKPPVLPPR